MMLFCDLMVFIYDLVEFINRPRVRAPRVSQSMRTASETNFRTVRFAAKLLSAVNFILIHGRSTCSFSSGVRPPGVQCVLIVRSFVWLLDELPDTRHRNGA